MRKGIESLLEQEPYYSKGGKFKKKKQSTGVQQLGAKLRELGYHSYKEYLASPHWAEVKIRWYRSKKAKYYYKKYGKYVCMVCLGTDTISLHHRTYDRLGHEYLSDLVMVCTKCHQKIHKYDKAKKYTKSLKRITKIFVKDTQLKRIRKISAKYGKIFREKQSEQALEQFTRRYSSKYNIYNIIYNNKNYIMIEHKINKLYIKIPKDKGSVYLRSFDYKLWLNALIKFENNIDNLDRFRELRKPKNYLELDIKFLRRKGILKS